MCGVPSHVVPGSKIGRHLWAPAGQALRLCELRVGSIADVDPGVAIPFDAGIRVVRGVVRIAVVAQAQSETCERQTPAPASTKATTTEAGHANASADHWAAEAKAGDTYATETTSNRTPSTPFTAWSNAASATM